MGDQPALESSVVVAATPERTWAAISDLTEMRRRSPELVGMWLFGAPKVGRRGINLNRRKGFVWPTTTRITRWKDPAQDGGRGALAFHVGPSNVEWSYELEPAEGGTRVTERRTAVVDPNLVVRLTARLALGGADGHDAELADGINHTLATLKADLER